MNTKSPPTSHRGATDVSRRLLSFLHGKTGGDSSQPNRGASGTPFLTAMTFLWPAGIVILFLIASGFLALAQAPSITPASQSAIDRNEFEKMEANAASGNAEAQDKLGVLYATGKGVEKNYAKAIDLPSRWVRPCRNCRPARLRSRRPRTPSAPAPCRRCADRPSSGHRPCSRTPG